MELMERQKQWVKFSEETCTPQVRPVPPKQTNHHLSRDSVPRKTDFPRSAVRPGTPSVLDAATVPVLYRPQFSSFVSVALASCIAERPRSGSPSLIHTHTRAERRASKLLIVSCPFFLDRIFVRTAWTVWCAVPLPLWSVVYGPDGPVLHLGVLRVRCHRWQVCVFLLLSQVLLDSDGLSVLMVIYIRKEMCQWVLCGSTVERRLWYSPAFWSFAMPIYFVINIADALKAILNFTIINLLILF